MPPAIEIDAVTKRYGKNAAVNNVSLSVPAGQVLGFLGPNGAGKTTLIKMICGLIHSTAGDIRVNGYHITRQRSQAMQQIGVVLEGTRNVYWRLSAWQNLMYFGRLKGVSGSTLRQRAEYLLKMLGLWERRRDEAGEFSRGMQQKLAIACALIADPPIILLDEPTLGLDVQVARTLREQIGLLAQEQRKTIVITSHQLDMVQAVCHQVAIIKQGSLIACQPMVDLLNMFDQEHYVVTVDGHVDPAMMPLLPQIRVQNENGTSIISGSLDDPQTLHDLLDALHSQGRPLVSVQRQKPNLEDVFVQLTDHETHTARVPR